jgi:malate dehydrogenase (oxaloacetate-decarboxylating)(NADP+)
VASAYGITDLSFGPQYLIPKPFDPRLIVKIAPAVALAAMASGVATRPIEDMELYTEQLQQFVYHSGTLMKPLFSVARKLAPELKRIVYAEGEEERVLRAVQVVVDEKIGCPILIGRPDVIAHRITRYGLRLKADVDYTVVNADHDQRYRDYWQTYWKMRERHGVTEQFAKLEMRRRTTLIGAMMVKRGEADGMICGTISSTNRHLDYIDHIFGRGDGKNLYAAMTGLILPGRQMFLVDTHVNFDPSAAELADITVMAAAHMRQLGIEPKVALLSHSNFGSSDLPSAVKMREALAILHDKAPGLEVDGEMHGDCALDPSIRKTMIENSTLQGEANLLVMPNLDAANIAYNLLKTSAGNGIAIGPILLGCPASVHILTTSATVRRLVNMTALAVLDANAKRTALS